MPAISRSTTLVHSLHTPLTQLAATLFVAFAGLWIPDASADGITLDAAPAESDRAASLARIWRSAIRDAIPELEHDEGGVTTGKSWNDEFFCLRAPRGGVDDWGVQPPPLRLNGFTSLRYRNPIPTPVDVRIAPGTPLRLVAPKDVCLIDASARAEVNAAIWQPIFACMPLDVIRVRLNADLMYDWKGERLTTSLGLAVAQLFRVGPYEAEISGAVRAQPEANAYDWTYRALIKLPFPE